MTSNWLCVGAVAALLAGPASADVWDLQNSNDDTFGTYNELVHGTRQAHDLGIRPGAVADQDWYLMPQKRQASYEIIIDGVSGDFDGGPAIERVANDRTTVLQQATAAVTNSRGYSRALRWANTTSATINEYVRVSATFCGTTCGADDVYAIRVRETTVNVPRFNAAGTQVTVLLTQNATERSVDATFFYWSSDGTLLQQVSTALGPKTLLVTNVGTIPGLAGQSGHITIAHDGGYGGLVVKSVALEPSTGFSFDTPGVYVPD
jgi:hypothetical protein